MRQAASLFAAAAALALAAGGAVAQAPPAGAPAQNVRIAGTVTAVAPGSITIHGADGKDTQMGLSLGWTLVKAEKVDKSAVKPGAFVATANLPQGDSAGKSIEIRMFEPGNKGGEGSRPMTNTGAAPGQMMTNATVTKAAMTANGLELDVAYPGGSRHLVVPPDVPVIASIPQDHAALKAGMAVTAQAAHAPDGGLLATRISIDLPKT